MNKEINCSNQIDAYLNDFTLRHYQIKTTYLIKKNKPKFKGNFLDIGCGNGVYINFLSNKFKEASFTGVDISRKLINLAKKNNSNENSYFKQKNIDKYKPIIKFDIVNASGVLSNFINFKFPLLNWFNLLEKEGILIIFGCFNSENIDTILQVRNNYKKTNWQNGLTSYSIHTVSDFLNKKNIKHKFIKFFLPIDIRKKKDPVRSYTILTNKNKRIILTGANIVNELFHLVIYK